MSTVTTEIETAGAVVDEPMVPAQGGPADEQLVTAEAIAEALDPALVARLAAQARAQGVQLLGRGGVLQAQADAARELDWAGHIDSTVVRAYQHAAGRQRRRADESHVVPRCGRRCCGRIG